MLFTRQRCRPGQPTTAHRDFVEYYDPRYYAANIKDPDWYSIEAVYKNWQHPVPYATH
jgi:hypothetical protein